MLESVKRNGLALKTKLMPDPKKPLTNFNVVLRRTLQLYATVRPLKNVRGLKARFDNVDMLVIREIVDEHSASAAAAGQRLDLQLPSDLPPLTTDRRRVQQILGNLLSNAIKYTPAGGQIKVRAEIRTRDGATGGQRWAAIEVIDTGPGIPSDQVDRIFDEFSRLKIHEDKPGAGLGLAIARRVSRLLGGDLTVTSVDGRGSAFTLWLPLESDASGEKTPA